MPMLPAVTKSKTTAETPQQKAVGNRAEKPKKGKAAAEIHQNKAARKRAKKAKSKAAHV